MNCHPHRPHQGRRRRRRGRRRPLHRHPDQAPPPGRHLDPDHRVGRPRHPQGADGRAGSGRHHRHVPQPGPPQRSPRAGRLPRAQRRLPAHPGHGLRRRVHPPRDRRGQPRVRQRRHRRDQRPRLQRRHRRDGRRQPGPGHRLPGRRPAVRHRPLPRPGAGPLGDRAARSRRRRHRRPLVPAGRLLPAAGLPERHRDDRARHLPVAQPAADAANARRPPAEPSPSSSHVAAARRAPGSGAGRSRRRWSR